MAVVDALSALKALLAKEFKRIDTLIDENNTPYLLIDIIRAVDYYTVAEYEGKDEFDYYLTYGYSHFLKRVLIKSTYDESSFPLFQSTNDSMSFCHYYLVQYGKCRVVERWIELVEMGECRLEEISENKFSIRTSIEDLAETWDNLTIDSYFEIAREYLYKEDIDRLHNEHDQIQDILSKNVFLSRGIFIGYDSTSEIDDYYFENGRIHLLTTQLFDDFDENWRFGDIRYGLFLDVIQALMGLSFKHRDACSILSVRESEINFFDIITLPEIHEDSVEGFANYLGISKQKVRTILEILTVSVDNISDQAKLDKSFSPPFIKIGRRFVLRSIRGCLHSPIQFLHNELKRRFEKDYFKALNEREAIFRQHLYDLFDDERFIKIPRSIDIRFGEIRTDIDAVMFDKKTRSLGLFQLKWQDIYSSDVRTRRNRISNFYPKANEWVEKISNWTSQISTKEMLSSLRIPSKEVGNIYLFVLARYNAHFGNQDADQRAAWGSWYHVFKLSHKIKTDFDDPIRELHFKLNMDSPKIKGIPEEMESIASLKFENFSIEWSQE